MILADLTDVMCFDEQRRAAVRRHPTLNGIDFVEYFEDRSAVPPRYWLVVTFLKDAPNPASFYNLVGHPELFSIEGGTRVVGIRVTDVLAGSQPNQLELRVSEAGDFSLYRLAIDSPAFDPQLSAMPVNFKANCPTEFDCRQEPECPPTLRSEPLLDYLAKDYASFRRLLLDLIPQRNPRWLERNPADLGMALVELLAYAGDQLSYFQDAVATEAYLDTCRHRISAKRHARLVDYRMHDGRNAWGFVQVEVAAGGVVPQGTLLLTRIARPLRRQLAPPGTTIALADLDFVHDPALQDVTVFETTALLRPEPLHNQLWIHTWGNRNCCLPQGATGAYGYTLSPGTQQAVAPPLQPGDYLVFEEVRGPATGLAADANPAHRQVVRLETVTAGPPAAPLVDPLYRDTLVDGVLQPVTDVAQAALPLVHITWRVADALTFPLCLSTEHPETGLLSNISLARGNVVPCDHGRTVVEALETLPYASGGRPGLLELALPQRPLTFQAGPDGVVTDEVERLRRDRHSLDASPRAVEPAVQLTMEFPAAEVEVWTPVPDLLADRAFERHFVVDVDHDGGAILRFGDDEYGRRPEGVERITATYRIGNGPAGNLGRSALVHIVSPIDPLALAQWPDVREVRQPLPTTGGVDPESIEEVRQLAPRAFQAEQFRAVTEADYEAAAIKLPAVAAAKCTFRWTGSWHTVFVAIHPRYPTDLMTEAGGRTRLSDGLASTVQQHLTRYKLAGYDLEIRAAQYVPLEIDLQICVARGHFRGDVLEAVSRALSNRQFPDGSSGFFHPSRQTFGQDVYLSQIYATVERVTGVESAVVTLFKRYWALPNQELENAVLPLGDGEIARLDNDPNFAENGILRLTAIGGL